ncbi:L-2-amino-thiazoline-4-carboxylic acid hydrolase [Thalassococcus sp. S3]|uniref:L-2-amino-thiazoline-4-carboxylic acid hydrolase n=1 Tax=Thalassococcus sp. S3 TaxID=2017482 RepID=UPI0013EE4573|nr:L-2-amino-thiazoline-4-carboxylic acid hydrolase [Thalassococcus sp. S3]
MRFLFLSGFARALRRVTGLAPRRGDLQRRIARLPRHHAMPGGDRQADFNLLMVQSLQVAVSHLEDQGILRNDAVAMAKEAFLANGSGVTRAAFGLWLAGTRDPVAQMQKQPCLTDLTREMWGQGVEAHEVTGPDRVTLHVTRCPFADYLWNVAEPDLMPVFCAYDAQWMEQVNASRRPVTVNRSGTIATGAERCDFTFVRAEKAQAEEDSGCWGRING